MTSVLHALAKAIYKEVNLQTNEKNNLMTASVVQLLKETQNSI